MKQLSHILTGPSHFSPTLASSSVRQEVAQNEFSQKRSVSSSQRPQRAGTRCVSAQNPHRRHVSAGVCDGPSLGGGGSGCSATGRGGDRAGRAPGCQALNPGVEYGTLLAPFCAPFCSFCSPALPCPGHCSFQRLRAWELEVIALGSSAFSQGWEALMRGGGEVGGSASCGPSERGESTPSGGGDGEAIWMGGQVHHQAEG